MHACRVRSLCDPMDCSPPGASVHGILQARILKWGAISYSMRSSQLRDLTCISCVSCAGRQILYHYAIWKAQITLNAVYKNESNARNSMMNMALFFKTGLASVTDFVFGLRLQIWVGTTLKWHPDTRLRYPTSVKLMLFLFRHFSCMNITRCIVGPSFWVPVTFTMFRTALSSSQACLFEDVSQIMTLIKH